jgi:hypothetical protein
VKYERPQYWNIRYSVISSITNHPEKYKNIFKQYIYNIIMDENEEDNNVVEEYQQMQQRIKKEMIDDKINNLLIDMKFEMMDYIRQERISLLEFFNDEYWTEIFKTLL